MSDIVWLCVVRPDGSPHITPVWFVEVDDAFWIATARTNAKVRHIGATPKVSLAFENDGQPRVAEGVAELRNSQDDWLAVAQSFAEKYAGWDVTDESVDGARVLIRVHVSRWLDVS